MAFLKVDKEHVVETGGKGGYTFIGKAGIFDVTVKAVEVGTSKGGATYVNYWFDKGTSFFNYIISKEGKQLFNMDILNNMGIIAGVDELSDPEPTVIKFKESSKEVQAIPELTGENFKIWVQFKYSKNVNSGDIIESMIVRSVYRASDGATASEILAGKGYGEKLKKDTPFAEADYKYEDGLTEEEIKSWKEARINAYKEGKNAMNTNGVNTTSSSDNLEEAPFD